MGKGKGKGKGRREGERQKLGSSVAKSTGRKTRVCIRAGCAAMGKLEGPRALGDEQRLDRRARAA